MSVDVISSFSNVYALAAKDATGRQRVLLSNWTDQARAVTLRLDKAAGYRVSRTDEFHARLLPTGEAVADGDTLVIPWKGTVLLDRIVEPPQKVIFDTDMNGDFDDIGALAMLHKYADAGRVVILGTFSCLPVGKSVPVIETLNRWYGRADIPTGAPKLENPGQNPFAGYGLFPKYDGWYRHADAKDAPDALAEYRRILAAQPDKSVVICGVGSLTNFAKLLKDDPQLVAKKVKRLVLMACKHPEGKECNSAADPAASKYVFENWPTPIDFSDFDFGWQVYSGRTAAELDPAGMNPVRDVFAKCLAPRRECFRWSWDRAEGHPSWDQTAVLLAVEGLDSGLWQVKRGRFEMVGDDGTDRWTDDPKGTHARISFGDYSGRDLGEMIDTMIALLPAARTVRPKPSADYRAVKPAITPGKVKVCMDWDDSCFTDFRLAELCRKYKAKATFNITPRDQTDHCYMRRETTERNGTTYHFKGPEGFDRTQTVSIPYLTNKDFKYCYEGFKVAAHLNMRYGDTPDDLAYSRQLMEEFLAIAPDVTGQDGFGIVWSGGRRSPGIIKMAKELGYRYCRGANTYEKPGKWGEWTIQPTTYWSEPPEKFWEWYELAKKRGDVFWFWGHTQDLGYDDAIWARLEGIIKRISEDPDAEWIDVGDLAKEADSNRPQTWFHLIGGNVSKEGIVRDLDAIAEAGISGIQFFHGQFGGAWPHVAEQIPCLSGKWDDIVRFTAAEAKRRGLSFTLQNCPGWSYAGGPWVPVERSMRILDATRTDVRGGAVDAVLPKPAYPADKDDTRTDFRDLKVIAFPKLAGEATAVRPVDFRPVHFADTNSPVVLRYDLGREMTVRSVVFDNPRQMCWCWQSNPVLRIELFAETAAGEAKVGDWRLPMMSWQDAQPLTLPIAATTFRRCRFRFTYKSALHLDGISFLGEARYRSWESEAGYSNRELMKGDEPASVAGEAVDPKAVVDLTDRMDASGRLVATLPAGEWTVLRIGHASNGRTNAPAPEEATGFECDKLSAEAARLHFAAYTGRLAAKGAPLDGRLDGVLVDSWECRFQNWTAEGLDVRTADWPALFGYVVGDRAATRAFYRNWRNQLSARVNAGFYRTTADLIRSVGGKFWCEVGPGEVFPGDPMEYFKYADVPMCEFWLPFAKADEQVFDRPAERYSAACVSAAHVYGKRRVAAESFTSCITWNEDFKLMKEMMDAFFSLGVTYPVFHTYTHNPATDLPPPGTSFGEGAFGCPFLRGQTWWPYMRHFTDYLTRCTALLERGVLANDVLMYLGDDVNALPRTSEDGAWEHPAGFAVDYLNRDALMNRLTFKDGRVVSPEGAAWRAIWIPEGTYLAPETERRLAEAERAGVPVKRGAGTVAAFLAARGLKKDFDEPTGTVRHIHRKDGTKDIYFVCVNRKSGGFSGPVGFGAKGEAVVYDPVKDTRTAWDGRTLTLAPGGSAFVIFGEDVGRGASGVSGGHALSVNEIKSWTLLFPAGWGAPEKLTVEKLVPWCELPVSDEAKAFSGTVVYRTTFRGMSYEKLDLGRVETVAAVKVNGKDAGVLWCEPYVADIEGLCTDGENELEIAVTSTWHNRLWYDGQLPEANRKTWTLPYLKNLSAGRLLPYGLMENAK